MDAIFFVNINMNYFSNLTNLDLKYNREIGTIWYNGESKLDKLEQLNISGTSIIDLTHVLTSFPKLKILKYGSVDYESMTTMSNLLQELSPSIVEDTPLKNQIETLYLNNMKLTCGNIVELCNLKLYQQLTKLVLSENKICNQSIQVLSQVPNQLTSLTVRNCFLNDGCATHLCSFPKLKYLDVAWNFLTNSGCNVLVSSNLDHLDITHNTYIDAKLISSRPTSIKKIVYGWGRTNIHERITQ